VTIARFESVAKWYGRVIGLVDVTLDVKRGVVGLLGPNGAGKSTFLKLLTGQIYPSQGSVRLLDHDPFRTPSLFRRIGFCPEQDAFYESMTGREFVRYLASYHGMRGANLRARADEAIERVDLSDQAHRRIRAYSKGMRQRIKLAQALVHDPEVLILDEPLTGMDPVGRRKTIDLVRSLGAEGRTVLVSSHVLHEVEAMTEEVVLIYQGRVRAHGTVGDIRSFLHRYPYKVLVRSSRARDLSRELLALDSVVGVRLEEERLHVETLRPEQLYERLPALVLDGGFEIEELDAEDASLDAIFEYLVG